MSGKLITFEGPDLSGKSTQLRILAGYLRERGFDVLETREPGGTELGGAIRDWLLSPRRDLVVAAEAFLYLADRAQHVARVIRPALDSGRMVLCDRFSDSTEVYQGWAGGLATDFLRRANLVATGGLRPHLTLWFDLGDTSGELRREAGGPGPDRMELRQLQPSFRQLVTAGYQALAEAEPNRFWRVDARPSPQVVHEAVVTAVRSMLAREARRDKGEVGP